MNNSINNKFTSDNYYSYKFEFSRGNNETYGGGDYEISVKKKLINLLTNHKYISVTDYDRVLMAANGTGANIVAAAIACDQTTSVMGDSWSHYNTDESGALERMAGIKFIQIEHLDGKMTPEDIENYMFRQGDIHRPNIGMVTISNQGELGQIYTVDEIKALHSTCEKFGIYLHIDLARGFVAAKAINVSISEFVNNSDICSVSFTKIGALNADFVFIKNSELLKKPNLNSYVKGFGQMLSKQWMQYKQVDDMIWDYSGSWNLKTSVADGIAASITANRTISDQIIKLGYRKYYDFGVIGNSSFFILPIKMFLELKKYEKLYVWDRYDNENVIVRIVSQLSSNKNSVSNFLYNFTNIHDKYWNSYNVNEDSLHTENDNFVNGDNNK